MTVMIFFQTQKCGHSWIQSNLFFLFWWRPFKMELSVESCQYVTLKVRDFFELPSEIGYSLNSPEFRFADDTYCLRLYPNGRRRYKDGAQTEIELVRLTSTFSKRSASCKIGYRRSDKGCEVDKYWHVLDDNLYLFRSFLENNRDRAVPDGTFTSLCSMRLKEQSSVGSQQSEKAKSFDTKEEQKGLTGKLIGVG